jgi:O-antigen/teichoic acid export membrane protein
VETGAVAPPTAIESLGRGTVVMIIGTIVLLALSFLGRVATARVLSLEAFGEFNLGLSFVGLLSLVALLGLHQAVARTLARDRDPGRRRKLIRWTAVVTVLAAVVSSTLVYELAGPIASLFNPGSPQQLTGVFQLLSVTIGLTLLATFIASVFQGFEDTVPYAWIVQGVQPGAFLVFLVLFFQFQLALTAALLAWLVSNVVTFVALLIYAQRRLPRHLPTAPVAKELPAGLWSLALSLWGVTTLVFVTGYIDTLILGAFRPESQVGVYSAALILARLVLVASGAVTYIFLPVAARLTGEGDVQGIRTYYVTTGRWILVFATPLFLVFGLFPTDSLTAVFGATYAPGSEALVVVTAFALASVVFGPVNAALAGMAMTRPLLFATAVSAISNIVLSFTLIPTYGLMGAAIAWSVARVLYPAAGAWALHSQQGIGAFHRPFLLPFAVTLAVGVPLFLGIAFVPHPDWVVFPLYFVGLAVFLGAILLTRTVQRGDLIVCRLMERVARRPLPQFERFLERFIGDAPEPAPLARNA